MFDWEADHLWDNRWAVRPRGQLGTMGWYPRPWTVIYVNAKSEKEAIRKATFRIAAQQQKTEVA